MNTAYREKLDIGQYLYDLTLVEDAKIPFKPEYLRMDDDDTEIDRACSHCIYEKCYWPEDYCNNIIDRMEHKKKVLSAANRIIHALLNRGDRALPGYFDWRKENFIPDEHEANFDWSCDGVEEVCSKCHLHGKAECPEDVWDESCAKNAMFRAIEEVVTEANKQLRSW